MTKENSNFNTLQELGIERTTNTIQQDLVEKLESGEVPEEAEQCVRQLIVDYADMFSLAEQGILEQPDLSKAPFCSYSNPIEDEKLLCKPNELNRVQIKGRGGFNPDRTSGFLFVVTNIDANYYGEMKALNELMIYPSRVILVPFDDNDNFGEREFLFENPPPDRKSELFVASITPDRSEHIIAKMPLKVED